MRPEPLPLLTPRLCLRRFTAADLPTLRAYREDPEVARYQSWDGCTEEEAWAFLASQEAVAWGQPGEWLQIALEERATGAHVGDCAVRVWPDDPRQAEIGFSLARDAQGRGLGAEAVCAVLDALFSDLGLHRVVAVTDALNAPSAALLRRVGMRQEAHRVEAVFFKGAWGDELDFAVLAREWAARREG